MTRPKPVTSVFAASSCVKPGLKRIHLWFPSNFKKVSSLGTLKIPSLYSVKTITGTDNPQSVVEEIRPTADT